MLLLERAGFGFVFGNTRGGFHIFLRLLIESNDHFRAIFFPVALHACFCTYPMRLHPVSTTAQRRRLDSTFYKVSSCS